MFFQRKFQQFNSFLGILNLNIYIYIFGYIEGYFFGGIYIYIFIYLKVSAPVSGDPRNRRFQPRNSRRPESPKHIRAQTRLSGYLLRRTGEAEGRGVAELVQWKVSNTMVDGWGWEAHPLVLLTFSPNWSLVMTSPTISRKTHPSKHPSWCFDASIR